MNRSFLESIPYINGAIKVIISRKLNKFDRFDRIVDVLLPLFTSIYKVTLRLIVKMAEIMDDSTKNK